MGITKLKMNKKLGIAKRNLKKGEEFEVRLDDDLLHSDAINFFESIEFTDLLELGEENGNN